IDHRSQLMSPPIACFTDLWVQIDERVIRWLVKQVLSHSIHESRLLPVNHSLTVSRVIAQKDDRRDSTTNKWFRKNITNLKKSTRVRALPLVIVERIYLRLVFR